MRKLTSFLVASAAVLCAAGFTMPVWAQGGTPNHPTITVGGEAFTPLSILTRNMGTAADQAEQFPPQVAWVSSRRPCGARLPEAAG